MLRENQDTTTPLGVKFKDWTILVAACAWEGEEAGCDSARPRGGASPEVFQTLYTDPFLPLLCTSGGSSEAPNRPPCCRAGEARKLSSAAPAQTSLSTGENRTLCTAGCQLTGYRLGTSDIRCLSLRKHNKRLGLGWRLPSQPAWGDATGM